ASPVLESLCPACFRCYPVVVCTGTQNDLSMTGNPEIQYNLMKKMYTGCDIVMGNLEITMMEHSRDFSFLQSIKEVTGYILFALNEFSRLPLDHLRVIRGTTLYEERYALAVMVNYQKDGQHGLQELGLTHLTEILEGGVKIIQNKYLSYAPQVNWLDIVKNGASDIKIEDNGPEKPCNEACGEVPCWGPGEDRCQILTKTVCAPQCSGRCFGRNPSDCCHNECAGGCTGPLDTDCFACRNFNDSGSCMPQCPQALIYNKQAYKMEPNPNTKYQYGTICVAQCPTNFVVDGSSCVSNCPSGKTDVEKNGVKRCESCGGLCPKACLGTGSMNRQTVDASNIDSFINCTKIKGSLHFLVTGIEGDPFNNIPPLNPEKLKIFNTVREITDMLSIQSWPENMTDLSVFSNLQTIQGRTLYKGYALLVMKIQTLNSLGLRSLRKINDGGVYITGNKKLCYHHTVNWTRILSSSSARSQKRQKFIDVKENRPLNECIEEGHVCDSLCSSNGCWGPGPNQCVSCKKYSREGTCVPDCVIFKYPNKQGHCEPCHVNCTNSGFCYSKLTLWMLFSLPFRVSTQSDVLEVHLYHKFYSELTDDLFCFRQATTFIVLGVIALIFVSFSVFVLTILYRRGLAIRRKRAMRRYMASGESLEPLEEKGSKVHTRILKSSELRKLKLLGNGVFGSVHKGIWIPEGDTVKLPVAIKTIHDRTGRQNFCELTDHMMSIGSLNHINVVWTLGICPGESLQLITQLSSQGSLLEHVRKNKNKLRPQRMLNWCVQIAKGMNYLEDNRMVHRNLAARNVLLNNNFMAQISDYGIADLLYPDDKKYFYNEVKTPIKWMSLESILFRRNTHQSDVWSYGVTIWEMMSYGAEPYASICPQDVPDLLEKGERLSQPQICTIDVYMVMVKCWMIDENVRPTFKELANEFTRMARDPPRYLVIKVREAVVSPSIVAGYLPMTPGVDSTAQATWQSRSRLNSARTVSESSEGCGTALDQEMNEDFSLAGSLSRRRHREDSAYVSQRDSLSAGPSETPSPEIEEEDQNGYVLPGGTPERGETTTCNYGCVPISTLRPTDFHQGYEDEYKYMNKQRHTAPVSPRQANHWLKPKKKRTCSLSSQTTAYSYDTALSVDIGGGLSRSKESSDSEQQGSGEVEYEYMDIRGTERDESPPSHDPPPPPPPPPPPASGRMKTDVVDDYEYVEDSNHHYTNRQPKLRQALQDQRELKLQEMDQLELYEYEDMDYFAAPLSADPEVYQNMQRQAGVQRAGPHQSDYVLTGVGERVVGDRSFDNPGYWHSRIFLKPSAVHT
uniref:Receptor protein-tyrosine kinase n=1 Tax=Gouania willdenowi TaxID=441366 RepID=A0A8C5ELB4_GOUWI